MPRWMLDVRHTLGVWGLPNGNFVAMVVASGTDSSTALVHSKPFFDSWSVND